MVRNDRPPTIPPFCNDADRSPATDPRPCELTDLMDRVGDLLREGQPRKGLDLLARSGVGSPWAANATGVCLLRLGDTRRAIELFRGLVLGQGGLVLRWDVPTEFKTNFATALLMDGNVPGCTSVLAEVRGDDHPAVRKLRAPIRRWQEGMSLWEKVCWHFGSPPDRPVELGFEPGDL